MTSIRRDLRTSLLIGLCCLVIYNANGRAISAGDTYPARYLPFAIWKYHTVLLNPIEPVVAQGRDTAAFWIVHMPSGYQIPLYPIVLPVLVTPLYAPALGYLYVRGWTETGMDHVARVMEKIVSSLIAALSSALLYLLLRRRAAPPIALLLTIAFAFGTTTWVISSQALWQHGIAQLLIIVALLVITSPQTAPRVFLMGVLCALIAGSRPPDAIIAAALGACALFWAGLRRVPLLIVGGALPASLVVLYNLDVAGTFGGAYTFAGNAYYFRHDLLPGISGLLFSPTRGLFVFSPFLLFLALAWRHIPRDRFDRGLVAAMVISFVLLLIVYAKADWRGGLSFGPRYMTDLLPFFMWMLVPVVAALRGFGRACFVTLVCIAVSIEAVGAFCYTGVTDIPIYAVKSGPDELKAAWEWKNAPFIAPLQHGRAPAELLIEVRGSFDAIELDGHDTSEVTAGQPLFVAGWALAGHATPAQVAVTVDNQLTVATNTFIDRPDVREALHEASPAGWRIALPTGGLAPGEHTVSAYAWISTKGEVHFLAQRKLIVRPAPLNGAAATAASASASAASAADENKDLEAAFKTAVERVRAHQQERGYWLTAFTSSTTFKEPGREMNTYLTSLLVDLLDPLAATNDLTSSLQRARKHLTDQIEANGLVRYHGLPDAPHIIGTLGCAITPDSDDTALVWRIAPDRDRQRTLVPEAIAVMDRYRTTDGLYRTWLAERASYQCLDPGRDPNPADIAIQMHVFQFLIKAQRSAGRALCDALRKAVDEDRIWVYYRAAPLVPILRLTDLRAAGCPLNLPESRMRTTVPGQDIWVTLVRQLAGADAAGGGDASSGARDARTVLRQLASDDFALLRTSPPLLYHNDLSATVARYYWSEDAGYALWLRLAYEQAQLGHARLGD